MRSVDLPVVLSDGGVRIRPYCTEDVDPLYKAVRTSIDELAPWLPWCHDDYSREESAAWIASRPEAWAQAIAYSFAIVDAGDGTLLGGCGLNQFNPVHGLANLGYWVRADRTRSGVATRAARLVSRFGFETLALYRIEIVMQPENRASRRVAEKIGARYEGRCRNRLVARGTPCDGLLYGLIPTDCT